METAVAVAIIYTAAGLLMFLVNRKWKYIFLPFLYAIFGAVIGIIDGSVLCKIYCSIKYLAATLAAVYISVPYSLSKRRTAYMACMQALLICYTKLSRNNRVLPIFVA